MIASKCITKQELVDYQVDPYPIYDEMSPKVVETSQSARAGIESLVETWITKT